MKRQIEITQEKYNQISADIAAYKRLPKAELVAIAKRSTRVNSVDSKIGKWDAICFILNSRYGTATLEAYDEKRIASKA